MENLKILKQNIAKANNKSFKVQYNERDGVKSCALYIWGDLSERIENAPLSGSQWYKLDECPNNIKKHLPENPEHLAFYWNKKRIE